MIGTQASSRSSVILRLAFIIRTLVISMISDTPTVFVFHGHENGLAELYNTFRTSSDNHENSRTDRFQAKAPNIYLCLPNFTNK